MIEKFKDFLRHPYTPKWLTCIMIIILIWQCVLIITMMKTKPNSSVSSKSLQAPNNRHNAPISNEPLELFGIYISSVDNGASIKKSMLNFKVVGTLFSDNSLASQVIIQLPSKKEHLFQEGDLLPGGIELKQITSDYIVVLHDGVLERINLPKQTLNFITDLKPMNVNDDER